MTDLKTFHIPEFVDGKTSDVELAKQLIDAWRTDGIFQVARTDKEEHITNKAMEASKKFFAKPLEFKAQCISDTTYSGYIASGEEITAGEKDFSEIFTVCKDFSEDDEHVKAKWPCHGPCPWPEEEYKTSMSAFTEMIGNMGDRLLKLTALGLGLEINTLFEIAKDGWHHMRVLRFPKGTEENASRGIGAHTDYGLLVIANQNDVGGLYVRPPVEGEIRKKNWLEGQSSAGMYQNEDPWTFVKPVPRVFTCFPGDILQLMTNGYLLSTPHKVALAEKERYAIAYFHEPNFEATVGPIVKGSEDAPFHYGTHFTNMFMRCYPERITTERIHDEKRLETLATIREKSFETYNASQGTKE